MTVRPAWHLAIVLAAAIMVMHAPVLLGGETWADAVYLGEVVPARMAAAAAIADGHLPEWWSGTGLGVPLAAAPHHGALYPPHWLLAWGRIGLLDLVLLLHVWWAAVGIAVWARRLGADDLSAVVVGGAFAACGAVSGSLAPGAAVAICHLPWIGWAADRVNMAADARGRGRATVALAALLGVVGLTGQIAVLVDGVVLAIAIAASRPRHRRPAVIHGAIAIVAGLLLAAVQLWPAALHLTGDIAGADAGEPPRWLGLVIPGAGAPFVGVPLIALAVIGAVAVEGAVGVAVLGVAAVGVLLAGAWPHTVLTGDPALHISAAAAGAAALAGAGFTTLAGERPDTRTYIVLGAAVVALALAALSWPTSASAVAVAAGGATLAALLAAGARGFAAGAPLAAALMVGHPVALDRGRPRIERSQLEDVPMLLAPAASTALCVRCPAPAAPGSRVYRPRQLDADDPDPGRRARIDHDTGAGDIPSRFGLAIAQTRDPARRAIEDDVWRAAGTGGRRLLDRYGIEWAVLPASVATASGMTVAATWGRWVLVATSPARPRAFVAPRWRSVPDDAAAVAAVFPTTGDGVAPDTVVLTGVDSGGTPERVPIPPCDVRRPSPHEVALTCEAPAGGWAVLLDAWAPGWSVTVDGAAAPVAIGDALVRATRVDAGRHQVQWTYRTPGLRLGGLVSALAWLHLAGAAWLLARRRRRVPR